MKMVTLMHGIFIKRTKTAHLSGEEYEQRVAHELALQGFKGIKITPKTGDFGADILCFDLHGNSCAIQCKYYSKPIGYRAVEEAFAGARYYNCTRALLVTNRGFTKNARRGAERLGVELFICYG